KTDGATALCRGASPAYLAASRQRSETCEMELKSLRSRRLCGLCVFVGLVRHTQQIRELSVFNGAKKNAEDAETPRTQRGGVALGQLLKFLRSLTFLAT